MLPAPGTPIGSALGTHGLLAVASVAELEAAQSAAEEQEKRKDAVESSLAAHIRKCWESAKRSKLNVERQMLKNLRQRNGEYEQQKLAEIEKFGGSSVFMRLTDIKCRAAAAWIKEVLNQERPFNLEPTPVPSLPPDQAQAIKTEAYQKVLQQAQTIMAQGGVVDIQQFRAVVQEMTENALEAAEEETQQEARQKAEDMAETIEDQFAEGGYGDALNIAVDHDFVTFGTMILKGPVLRNKTTLQWARGIDGRYEPSYQEEIVPEVERVSPLDLYPSADAIGVNDGFLIEKYRVSRKELASFRGLGMEQGYNDDAINDCLDQYGRGGLREWTVIDQERRVVEGRLFEMLDPGETIDVLIFFGGVQGKLLREWGMTPDQVDDPLDDYEVEGWLINNQVIRCVLNDDPYGRPYHKAVYSSRSDGFWGIGLPEMMADVQQQGNAIARAMANNVAIASGPMVGVDDERLPPGEDGTRLFPWKVWSFNSARPGQGAPITFFQPEMKAQELMAIYQQWATLADEVTGIPRYQQGDAQTAGAGRTASGLSMLMGAAAKTVRSVVENIDQGIIEPLVQAFFGYNMLYNPDESIKGDCKAVALGASKIVVKEQRSLRLREFLQSTLNPLDSQIMGAPRRAELLRSVGESLDLEPDDVAPTREEMEQAQLPPPAAPAGPGQPAQAGQVIPQATTMPGGTPAGGRQAALYSGIQQ
jgi:hypothetical protein